MKKYTTVILLFFFSQGIFSQEFSMGLETQTFKSGVVSNSLRNVGGYISFNTIRKFSWGIDYRKIFPTNSNKIFYDQFNLKIGTILRRDSKLNFPVYLYGSPYFYKDENSTGLEIRYSGLGIGLQGNIRYDVTKSMFLNIAYDYSIMGINKINKSRVKNGGTINAEVISIGIGVDMKKFMEGSGDYYY